MNKKIKSTFFLTLTAIIWGTAFAAQRDGMSDIEPFIFSALRMYLGSLTLLPIIYFSQKKLKSAPGYMAPSTHEKRELSRTTLIGGALCGVIIFFAANFQQVGLVSVSAGKTAFITTLYILLVPVMGLFLKHKLNVNIWVGVILGTVGLYFLCITQGFSIAFGDLIVLIGAFFWACHILCVDHFVKKVMATKLVAIQFLVAGTMSLVVSLFVENFQWHQLQPALFAILYTGIMSSGFAFTFQALGQKDAHPTTASIILSTEALFGAISGYIFLQELFTAREFLGCILMFAAVIIAQLPPLRRKPID